MSVYGEANIDGGYAEDGVPGVVYAAVRIRGDPVKPTEIADACDTEANRIMRDMRRMVADLPFKVEFEGVERRYVERYADELDVDDQFKSTALSLCDDAVDGGLHNGKAPSAFAASVVYAASYVLDAGVEQADVASVADVSVTIIRRYYRKVIAASNDTAASPDDIPAIVDHVIDGIGGAIPDAVRHDAKEMSHAIDPDADWVRRCDPKAVAAAVVYVAAKRNRVDVTQAEAGEPVGMSRHAVNARSQDVKEWDTRRRLEDANYNRLKELAAENGAGVGSTPERDVLIDVLAELGVEP
jgi:transcription initiation factor TFIIIB Brf1 subunit/transcription initiation factor TFIIB